MVVIIPHERGLGAFLQISGAGSALHCVPGSGWHVPSKQFQWLALVIWVSYPLKLPAPWGSSHLLQTYSPCYPESWKVVLLRGKVRLLFGEPPKSVAFLSVSPKPTKKWEGTSIARCWTSKKAVLRAQDAWGMNCCPHLKKKVDPIWMMKLLR